MRCRKIVYVMRTREVSCVTTPTQFPWEIRFHLVNDRGRVIVLKIAGHQHTGVQ